MKRNKLLAILLTLAVVAALLPASFSAVSASPSDDDDQDPTGHCIETYPAMQGMFIRADYVDYDVDEETGWLEFYAPEDMEVVGMEFLLREEDSDIEDRFTFTGFRAFAPDLELTDDGIYTISLTGKAYDPEAPVSLKKGDVLLHLDFTPFRGFCEFSFRMWNLVVRTPDGDLAKYEYGRKAENGGEPLLRGDVMRDLRVDINDATELQKCLAEYKDVFFIASAEEPTMIDLCLADMDGDRKITVRDVTAIQSHLAEADN